MNARTDPRVDTPTLRDAIDALDDLAVAWTHKGVAYRASPHYDTRSAGTAWLEATEQLRRATDLVVAAASVVSEQEIEAAALAIDAIVGPARFVNRDLWYMAAKAALVASRRASIGAEPRADLGVEGES